MTHSEDLVARSLRAMRVHLGLDVAFVGEFVQGERVFRYVDAAQQPCTVKVGASDALEESYCAYVADGRLPGFLRDPARHPVAAALPATRALPVGTHLSVPITFSDGRLYGTFCCFSHSVLDRLDQRDLAAVEMMATMVAGYLEERDLARRRHERRRRRVSRILAGQDPIPVLQPIVRLDDGGLVGAEALSRFPTLSRGPAPVFAEAWDAGLGEALEVKSARAALARLHVIPAGAYLAINASPATVVSHGFQSLLQTGDAARIVVEVTENAAVQDYDRWLRSARALSRLGVRLAVDDVGTGFSGLHHILRVRPDILKIDRELVHGLDTDAAKRAMIAAIVAFAPEVGADVVAEGVEHAGEAACLVELGVRCAQGHHFGRPRRSLPKGRPVPAR
jgi:EAL domain-containing protein (putative c-di-GMP-specific phosphodiesterase class I)